MLVPLTLGPGWIGPCFLYRHRGRVFATGTIGNGAGVGSLIGTVPAGLRPSKSVNIVLPTVPEGTDDAFNPALNLPILWESQIQPDGKWVLLTALPESVKVTPPEAEWYYVDFEGTHPQYIAPLNLTIALGNASWVLSAEVDAPTLAALAAYLDASFTDEGSGYLRHDSRVHLGGQVKANSDGPFALLDSIPAGTTPGTPEEADVTTGLHGGNPIPIFVNAFGAAVSSDPIIAPVGDTPPLFVPAFGKRSIGPGKREPGEEATGPTLECPVDFFVIVGGKLKCEVGIKQICAGATHLSATWPIDIAEILGDFLPQPDWFLVSAAAKGHATQGYNKCKYKPFQEEEGGPIRYCGEGCDVEGQEPCVLTFGLPTFYDNAGAVVPPTLFESGGTLREVRGEGWLAPPAPLYKGEAGSLPEGVVRSLLWTPAQAAVITAEFEASEVYGLETFFSLTLFPFYDRRQIGLHAGEVLDLSKTGWPAIPGVVFGPERSGMVKLSRTGPHGGGGSSSPTTRAGVVANGP